MDKIDKAFRKEKVVELSKIEQGYNYPGRKLKGNDLYIKWLKKKFAWQKGHSGIYIRRIKKQQAKLKEQAKELKEWQKLENETRKICTGMLNSKKNILDALIELSKKQGAQIKAVDKILAKRDLCVCHEFDDVQVCPVCVLQSRLKKIIRR